MSEVASSLGGMPDATRPLPDLVLGDAVVDRDALRRSEPDLIERLLAVYDEVFPLLREAVRNRAMRQYLRCEPLEPLFKVR